MAEQSLKNHARFDPKIHFFLMPLALLCFIASIVHAWKGHPASPADILLVPVTFCVMFTIPMFRMYSLKVQDRLIRLEEQTRLRLLGVEPSGLSIKQFVALRFASDHEVGALALRAKTEGLTPKQIKEAIVTWRADNDRV